jgi:hypothetical protein
MRTGGALSGMIVAASMWSCSSSSDKPGSELTSEAIEPIGILKFADSDCRAAVDPRAPLRTSGVLDYVEGNSYGGVLLVKVGANVSALSAVAVELTVEGNGLQWVIPWEEFPSEEVTTSVPGYRAALVHLTHGSLDLSIGRELANAARGALKSAVATLRVQGTTGSGQAVSSAPWQYPITLCYGCLVAFPPEALVPQGDGSLRCTVNVPSPLCSALDCPCASGSDEPIDCRLCNREPVCMTPP